ncbi:MAG: neuron derived neurotrophic factor [uncultured bacterium]|uniref:Cytochrome b5 heme-binding domain-containing protein n=1 Tax=Candidatus Daviesbacteria bacterium GW2011_GWC2_40_12 TaxID=1618431 RepID=A0A0G0TVJ0_9BACT|nr:MAG: neuron derived neurotrophic factor [uncultured bacterium]KKQ84505.1 MAG: hypothetical protein UT04_C0015G0013 [Candidatus Daviesbacteria bacterium GW2011_GWF2_38_7]KKR16148.1 MAG: hypothetical protein UT45_C0008G0023 [Candidatus Daviesbacteria bacterium GW2011_GWA2_39_33]KKR41927.1 MAG: hypothetical protein UT77_C0005G0042 [Candidatus Daviesbacteria bacterium GW2011_GWC2_40_12]HCE30597.1 hypothetical protein [Candidatus Daviesbacteria bacterium]
MKRIIFSAGLIFLFLLVFLVLVNFYINSRYKPDVSLQPTQTNEEAAKTFTQDELKKYNGTDADLPIYLALDGVVYDVTAGREFYASGGAYHYLAGKDASIPLHLVGADIIKNKYPVVGKLVK